MCSNLTMIRYGNVEYVIYAYKYIYVCVIYKCFKKAFVYTRLKLVCVLESYVRNQWWQKNLEKNIPKTKENEEGKEQLMQVKHRKEEKKDHERTMKELQL